MSENYMNNEDKYCNCSRKGFKIVHTHGRKSRGYKVCKNCRKLMKGEKERWQKKKKK